MTPSPLPPEHCRLFLAVRRGVPLALAALLALLALVEPAGRGWARGWLVLGAVALLGEVAPTFRQGRAWLKTRRSSLRWDAGWVRALRPLFRVLGLEEAWILSFCAWNNRQVRGGFAPGKAGRALVLLPHCIQMARCSAEVLKDLSNCYECGLCPVGDLLPLHIARGWQSRISNRSHKAYREAREYRPDLIVAVSCVDRLFKGLVKLPEVPCYVIPLELPHRMCVDTLFSVPHLLAAMELLVEPRARAESGERVQPFRREGIA